AEDGIRYFHVTGVQTCALPIFRRSPPDCPCRCIVEGRSAAPDREFRPPWPGRGNDSTFGRILGSAEASEERSSNPTRSSCSLGQIGRASCRERVQESGGAGMLR